MNHLLQRQLRRLSAGMEIEDPLMRDFLGIVSKTYDELEENREFLAHTLEITSMELTEANERLRRESESRLRRISDYYEETLDQQPNVIFRCAKSADGFEVRLARGSLLKRLGLEPAQIEKDGISALIEDPAHLRLFERAWHGVDQRFEVSYERLELVCEFWLHPLRGNGVVTELIGIVSDVTRQKAAEDRLRQTSEDLSRRAGEMEGNRRVMLSMIEDLDQSHENIARERDRANALAQEAAAANRAKSDFLATMSHEIRTPMNGVLGFTELLQNSELSQQQMDFVTSIRSSAEALLRVINDVLDFSKIESGFMDIEARPFSLQECIEQALETVSTRAAEKGLDLAARLAPGVPSAVIGDSLRMRQVLVNLLGNSVKFTPSGEVRTEVTAEAADEDSVRLTFAISDTGIGISPDRLDRLFEPFHQEDSSTSRRFGGSGLGLAICRRLVELMGGSISVTSRKDEGSVFPFQLTLPIANDPPPMVAPLPFPDFVGMRVLLVDGHRLSRQVISELLEGWGLELRHATSMDEAVLLTDGWQPRVLLLDVDCDSSTDIEAATSLARQGVRLFLLNKPGGGLALRERLGGLVSATLLKPLKISPLFNSLLGISSNPGALASAPLHSGINPVGSLARPIRPLRLLLAEDNAINRKLALAALAQMGCQADVAVDGYQALAAAKASHYDAILMDVQMPGMDGLEATRMIRQWESETGASPTRIIALTANALVGDRDVCLKAGMDDYLPKPIRLEDLRFALKQVGEALEKSPARSSGATTSSMAALRQLATDLSPEDAVSLASEFLADLSVQLQGVQNAIDTQDSVEARRLAHSLKGTSSIFALDALKDAADAVEQASREGRLADAGALCYTLRDAADDAAAELRAACVVIASHSIVEPMS